METTKNKKGKKVLVALIAMLVMVSSTAAFAWWDSLTVNKSESNIITIGEGLDLAVANAVIDPLTDGTLIPASAVLKTGDTYQIDIDYEVSLDYTVDTPLNLAVTVSNVLINGVADTNNYIIIAVTNPGTVGNSAVTVTLSVTLDDNPADPVAAKATLESATISFDIEFAATVA
ncbi:MAG: hypothetical protein AB7S44_01910 [Spirochaetales bacterium]